MWSLECLDEVFFSWLYLNIADLNQNSLKHVHARLIKLVEHQLLILTEDGYIIYLRSANKFRSVRGPSVMYPEV